MLGDCCHKLTPRSMGVKELQGWVHGTGLCHLMVVTTNYMMKVFIKTYELRSDMAANASNPHTRVAEAGGSLQVWGQSGLYSEFQASRDYIVRPYFR